MLAMTSMSKRTLFPNGAGTLRESRFETFDLGPFLKPEVVAGAQLRWKLQKIFPLPPENSEPEDVRVLLKKIQAKLSGSTVPEDR